MQYGQYIAWLNGTSVMRGSEQEVTDRAIEIFNTIRWQETHVNKPTELRITKGARQTLVSTRTLQHVAANHCEHVSANHGQAPQFETTNQLAATESVAAMTEKRNGTH